MPVPNPQDSPQRLWQQSLAQCLAALHTQAEGLDDREAARRLARVGPNLLRPRAERALLLEFLAHFRNPLVLVLLAASAIAGFLGDVRSFVVISAIVLMSVSLDFMQEYRAGRAAERLKRQVALRATVVRGGQAREVAVADLVPGDVVLLAAGDLVPADGRVLEARDLFVNQSLLTANPTRWKNTRRISARTKARAATSRRRPTRSSWAPRSSAAPPGWCWRARGRTPRWGRSPTRWRGGRRARPSSAAPRPSAI